MAEILENFHFSSGMWGIILPCSLMALDIITGLLYSWANRCFKSAKMRTGLTKKCGELIIIILGELFSFAVGLPKEIMNGILLYISLMEFMSIIENLDRLNVPIPGFIKRVINENTVDDIVDTVTGGKTDDEDNTNTVD